MVKGIEIKFDTIITIDCDHIANKSKESGPRPSTFKLGTFDSILNIYSGAYCNQPLK